MNDDKPGALLWHTEPRAARGRKPSLSLQKIVTAAIELADSEDLDKLSMKNLAKCLDCGVMSIYRHVPNKGELLAAMLDTAFGDPPQMEATDGWRSRTIRWAQALRGVFTQHPWAITIIDMPRVSGPNETAWLEAELHALAPLDLKPTVGLSTALAVSSYVIGAAKPRLKDDSLLFGHLDHPETFDRYPRLTTILHPPPGLLDFDELEQFFEFGLNQLLDGIEAGCT